MKIFEKIILMFNYNADFPYFFLELSRLNKINDVNNNHY